MTSLTAPLPAATRAAAPVFLRPPGLTRVGLLSVHTSPLAQPGTGDGGGLNVYVRETAKRLAARGIRVDVFTRWEDPSLPATMALADGVDVHHIEAGPVERLPKEEIANQLCSFLLALQRHPTAGTHDVLHAHYWLSGWVGRRLAPRWSTPLVQTFHTLGVLKNAHLAPGDVPEPPLRLIAERRIARAADRLLVLTRGEARLLHERYGVPSDNLAVVPAGVDLTRFVPRATPVGSGAAPELLFVGRLQPLKGPDVAVRTYAEVRRHLPQARLRVVGGVSGAPGVATDPNSLRALARELGVEDGVTIEPAVEQRELVSRYHRADVVLVPSRSETFGLVALEAQACGTPVVAAAVPGLEAVVGDGGTLVEGHDPEDHAAAVLRYLGDAAFAAEASAAGISTGRSASWRHTVDRLVEVYTDVAAQRLDAAPVAVGT